MLLSLAAVEAAGFYSALACHHRAAGVALARMLVRHAFVWLLFVTVLHMWNDFGFDGFFGLRRRVLRISAVMTSRIVREARPFFIIFM